MLLKVWFSQWQNCYQPTQDSSRNGQEAFRNLSGFSIAVKCKCLVTRLVLLSRAWPSWDVVKLLLRVGSSVSWRLVCGVGPHLLSSFSCSVVSNSFVTPQTVAHQAPLSVGFSRQEYCSGLPFPPPGGLPDPGIEPALQVHSLPLYHLGSPPQTVKQWKYHDRNLL